MYGLLVHWERLKLTVRSSEASNGSGGFQDKLGVAFETPKLGQPQELHFPPSRLREVVRRSERTTLEIELQSELHLAGGLS
jgi:hypothetical protein